MGRWPRGANRTAKRRGGACQKRNPQMAEWICPLFFVWVVCGALGYWVASNKEAENVGLWVGLLLGPIGVVVACLLDGRPCCPTCGTRLNRRPSLCPQCATRFEWSDGGKLGTFFPSAGKVGPVAATNTNLIPCPDCGNQVSRLAKACPKCGRPIAV